MHKELGWIRIALLAIWLSAVIGSSWILHRYEATPGGTAARPTPKPPQKLANALLVFAHPQCPCTQASLQNVERFHRDHPEIRAELVLVIPKGAPKEFAEGPTLQWHRKNPWATLVRDEQGAMARSYGATTSGHVIYIDETGRTRFNGGVTRGRGLVGDSTALRNLYQAVSVNGAKLAQNGSVFGCSLLGDNL